MRLLSLIVMIHSMALADGEMVQCRKQMGDLMVTLFAAPADISVLLQNRENLEPVLDADVSIAFPSGVTLRLTHEQATNRLLYASSSAPSKPGKWPVVISIVRNGRHLEMGATVDVIPQLPESTAIWSYFFFPPAMVAAFALREHLINRKKGG
jgi:hypothetical protein